jgi:hypothetical protein
MVDEILPRAAYDPNTLGNRWVMALGGLSPRLGRLPGRPAVLDPVAARLTDLVLPAEGLSLLLRCLTAWWRLDVPTLVDGGPDPDVMAAAVLRLVSWRCGARAVNRGLRPALRRHHRPDQGSRGRDQSTTAARPRHRLVRPATCRPDITRARLAPAPSATAVPVIGRARWLSGHISNCGACSGRTIAAAVRVRRGHVIESVGPGRTCSSMINSAFLQVTAVGDAALAPQAAPKKPQVSAMILGLLAVWGT